MRAKLKDPNLSANTIVHVNADGSAMRNDGVKLRAANQNPFYTLATIHGEQGDGEDKRSANHELVRKNRSDWSIWAQGKLRGDRANLVLKLFRKRLGDERANLPDHSSHYDFGQTYYSKPVAWNGFQFRKTISFQEATFNKSIDISEARFDSGGTFFRETEFNGNANFKAAQFNGGGAYFRGALFRGGADFGNVQFQQEAFFKQVKFLEEVQFGSAVFFDFANFSEAYLGSASFHKVNFNGNAFFNKAIFCQLADFSSTTFKSTTRFNDARFLSNVPKFHASEMYDDTVFPIPAKPEENWPPVTSENAEDQKRAYSRLRLFFNKSQQVDEEQFFHRREMHCKRALAAGPTRWLFSLYALLSDYGISIWRPLAALALLIAFTGILMGGYLGMTGRVADGTTFFEGMGWSLANTLPFTGFTRTYMGYEYFLSLPIPFKVLGGIQTILGIILLFLLGLGLRNTFRLR